MGVRFAFLGEPERLEIHYRTETTDLGYRGAGAGTQFVLYRGTRRIDSADAQLGEGRIQLAAGEGPDAVTLYLPEGMRPTVLELQARGGEIRPPLRQPRNAPPAPASAR